MNTTPTTPWPHRLKAFAEPMVAKLRTLPGFDRLAAVERRFVWRTWMAIPVAAVLTIAALIAFHHIRYQSFRYQVSGTVTSYGAIRQDLTTTRRSLGGRPSNPAGAAAHIATAAGDLKLASDALSSVEAWSSDDKVLKPLFAAGNSADKLHAHDSPLLDTARAKLTAAKQQIAQAKFVYTTAEEWPDLSPPGALALALVPSWNKLATALGAALASGDVGSINAATKGLKALRENNATCASLENALAGMSAADQLAGMRMIGAYGTALAANDQAGADALYGQITLAYTSLGQSYQVVLARNAGVLTGIVRQSPQGAKHYYLVAVAQDAQGKAVQLDIPDSEHAINHLTSTYAIEVPKSVYDRYYRTSLQAARDGTPLPPETIGSKAANALSAKYTLPVLSRMLAFPSAWQRTTP